MHQLREDPVLNLLELNRFKFHLELVVFEMDLKQDIVSLLVSADTILS